ncbi:MAG: hypothetical protein CVU80_00690 [Elusimicrobia bacterium HGW-Elusimicrobia-4]|nr:MAG: hypothetical protein CVU80_00690 [Elusimicrobia bacterium HGW-Elusimicrobia-4]
MTLEIVGTVITTLSFIYAIYENRQRAKLTNYNREQAWEIYRQSLRAVTACQQIDVNKINDKEIIKYIIEGEANTQELAINAIRMIKRFEKQFDTEVIEKWFKEGKIQNESQLKAFKYQI